MDKPYHQLSFITVNYNGVKDTRALIRSIEGANLTIDYCIVVVDNASVNDEWASLSSEFSSILGCRSNINLGFAGGNNLALTLVEADYYYFINNDTIFPDAAANQLESMISYLSSDHTIGGLCPKIKYLEPANLLQYAGCTSLSPITLRNKQIGYKEFDIGQYEDIAMVPYMHGAAMLVRNEVIKEVGPMPEFYFLYYEELDWCEAIVKKYKLLYYPQATILHKESASTGVDSPLKKYYLTRNRLIFAYRNRKGVIRAMSITYLVLAQCVKGLVQFIQGNLQVSKAILNGIADGLFWVLKAR